MIRIIAAALLALSLAGCGYGGGVTALGYSAVERPAPERLPGRVYLLRGLIGDIYSLGMDELAWKIERRGIKTSVHGVSSIIYLANSIIREYHADPARTAPIVLVGHSTGGDAILSIAWRLKAANVPVALAIGFDPTRIASGVPSNVDLFINLYQGSNIIGGGTVYPAPDFRGSLVNVDLRQRREILHVTLDKNDAIHELIVRKIGALAERAQAMRSADTHSADMHSSVKDMRKGSPRRPSREEDESITPLAMRYVVPPGQTIELWDSAVATQAAAGETLEQVARRTGAPAWALAQINRVDPAEPLREGRKLLIPRSRLFSASDLRSEHARR